MNADYLVLDVQDQDPVTAEAFGGRGEFVGAFAGDLGLRGLGPGSGIEPGGSDLIAF